MGALTAWLRGSRMLRCRGFMGSIEGLCGLDWIGLDWTGLDWTGCLGNIIGGKRRNGKSTCGSTAKPSKDIRHRPPTSLYPPGQLRKEPTSIKS